jgi:hypothetical protein
MDRKQMSIFHNICDKFKLPYANKFIQHRNLKEFRYFFIERVNPTHRILLYGKLKKSYDNCKQPNRIIKVGEIILSGSLICLDSHSLFFQFLLYFLSFYLQTFIFYNYFFKINLGVYILNAYRDRRECWKWKNNIWGKMC